MTTFLTPMQAAAANRQRCSHVIEGPNGALPGRRPRPWWRRNCLRLAEEGTDRCWQHRRTPEKDPPCPVPPHPPN